MYLPSRDSHRGEGLGGPGAQLRSRQEGKGQGGLPSHTPAPQQTQPLGPRGPVMEERGRKAFVSKAWVWWAVCCLKGAWWCWGANAGDGDTLE